MREPPNIILIETLNYSFYKWYACRNPKCTSQKPKSSRFFPWYVTFRGSVFFYMLSWFGKMKRLHHLGKEKKHPASIFFSIRDGHPTFTFGDTPINGYIFQPLPIRLIFPSLPHGNNEEFRPQVPNGFRALACMNFCCLSLTCSFLLPPKKSFNTSCCNSAMPKSSGLDSLLKHFFPKQKSGKGVGSTPTDRQWTECSNPSLFRDSEGTWRENNNKNQQQQLIIL